MTGVNSFLVNRTALADAFESSAIVTATTRDLSLFDDLLDGLEQRELRTVDGGYRLALAVLRFKEACRWEDQSKLAALGPQIAQALRAIEEGRLEGVLSSVRDKRGVSLFDDAARVTAAVRERISQSPKTTELQNQLAKRGLELVKETAYKIRRMLPSSARIGVDELIDAGNEVLLDVIRRFDPNGKIPFDAFARRGIRWGILNELRRSDLLSSAQRALRKKIEEEKRKLQSKLGREPSSEEVASAMGIDLDLYHTLVGEVNVRLVDVVGSKEGGDEGSIDDLQDSQAVEPERGLIWADLKRATVTAFLEMSDEEQIVIGLLAFGLEETKIAEMASLSQPTISRVKSKGIQKMRKSLSNAPFDAEALDYFFSITSLLEEAIRVSFNQNDRFLRVALTWLSRKAGRPVTEKLLTWLNSPLRSLLVQIYALGQAHLPPAKAQKMTRSLQEIPSLMERREWHRIFLRIAAWDRAASQYSRVLWDKIQELKWALIEERRQVSKR